MKKSYFFPILLAIVFNITLNENSTAQFNPDSLELKVQGIVRKYVDSNHAAVVVGIIRKEGSEGLFKRYTFGHVRKDTTSPRPDTLTIFHIGSVTKSYTATILSMLIQEGGPLNLNDLVQDHIPDSIHAPVYVSATGDTTKMRIIDLVTHYSALPDDPIMPIHDSTSYEMMYHYLNAHRLSRPPGECYLYSNLGVSFSGVVVTHTLGKIIDTLFIEKIANPLNMPDTRISLNSEQLQRRAVGYVNGDSVGYFKNSWPAFYAAGGLYTTLRDFQKYLNYNMGLSGVGLQGVLDSAHKIRRVNNDTCSNPGSKGRIGMVWQMELLNPLTDSTFYFTWKDGGVPGFSSYICFADNSSKELKTGVVMIANQSIACDKLAIEILKYLNSETPSGITQLSQSIPEKFSLYQNYPNPFNPTSKIKFDVPANKGNSSKVTLVIYDLTGKEISKPVDEKLNAGSYEVQFDGTNLSSGVYFCKLSNGNYFQTKKMFLVK